MKNFSNYFFRFTQVVLITFTFALFLSCEKEAIEPELISDADAVTSPRATYSSRTVQFTRSNGTYSSAEAESDFGNISGWKESLAYISSNTARIKLLKDKLTSEGGITASFDIPDKDEYTIKYDVKFHSEFLWRRGGKVGFGLKLGDGNTGCDKADDGNGGSARVMWYSNNTDVYFIPYAYYKDMPGTCGNNFNMRYPKSGDGSISRGKWYTIEIRVKSNTYSNNNGGVKFFVNGNVMFSNSSNFRWTTNHSKRQINKAVFAVFRGGKTDDWKSPQDDYIYFDNVSWKNEFN